ncbi:hypothetical protein D3C73_752280 [compost metagenome]
MSVPHLALIFSESARFWPQGPRVSALITISPVSNDRAIATDTLRRLRDRPSARSAVSSEVAASWPRPISAPITAAVGNIV